MLLFSKQNIPLGLWPPRKSMKPNHLRAICTKYGKLFAPLAPRPYALLLWFAKNLKKTDNNQKLSVLTETKIRRVSNSTKYFSQKHREAVHVSTWRCAPGQSIYIWVRLPGRHLSSTKSNHSWIACRASVSFISLKNQIISFIMAVMWTASLFLASHTCWSWYGPLLPSRV